MSFKNLKKVLPGKTYKVTADILNKTNVLDIYLEFYDINDKRISPVDQIQCSVKG